MTLSIFFSDDEHTASEGVYSRLMKSRKWLYLSAGLATAMSLRLYHEGATLDLLKVFSLPADVLSHAVLFGLIYMAVQFGLLVFQLVVTYDITLKERLAYRKEDDEAAARSRLQAAQVALSTHISAKESDLDDQLRDEAAAEVRALSSLDERVLELRKAEAAFSTAFPLVKSEDALSVLISDNEVRSAYANIASLKSLVDEASKHLENLQKLRVRLESESAAAREVKDSLYRSVEDAKIALSVLQHQDPAKRQGYRNAEVAIDLSRIAPPAIVALGAIVNLTLALNAPGT